MRYRPLGSSGLVVSVVGLGCNNFGRVCDLDRTRSVVDAALDVGINLFDTADLYRMSPDVSSELFLGEVLAGRRDDVVIATKFGMDLGGVLGQDWGARGSRRYVRKAVEASLRCLRTDWIDLYQYHEPDGVTPMEETLAALHELVCEGKIRYIGLSNVRGWEIAHADWVARTSGHTRAISVQNHYSLLERGIERDVVPACERYGIGVLPYFPLANGLLTGKYRRGVTPPAEGRIMQRRPELLTDDMLDRVEALVAYGKERDRTLLEVAISGLAAQPAVSSVIAGATTPEQVRANAAAAEWQPTQDDLIELDLLTRPRSG